MSRPAILVIGGTDSSGGAGLAADIRAAAAHDVDARLAVTAVTAQTDGRVGLIEAISPAVVAQQIAMAREDGQVSAVKIGMLGNEPVVSAVADALSGFGGPIVLDPVVAATSGGLLLSEAGIATMIHRLLPAIALVTPNLPELAVLAVRLGVASGERTETQARALLDSGKAAVLVKGGHGEGQDAVDSLYRTDRSPARFAFLPGLQEEIGNEAVKSFAAIVGGHVGVDRELSEIFDPLEKLPGAGTHAEVDPGWLG